MGELEQNGSLSPDLAALERQFEAVEEAAAELTKGLSGEQLLWRPAPRRWSIAECLDHLNAVGYKVLPCLDDLLARAESPQPQPRGPEHRGAEPRGRFRPGLVARLLIRFVEPPYRLRLRLPRAYLAPPPEDPERVKREFVELQGELIKRLYGASEIGLDAARVPSPANPRLRLNFGEWLSFLAAHERRHLWQAERVRRHPAFPGGR